MHGHREYHLLNLASFCFLKLFILFLVETVSLCSQGCPGIHHSPDCLCLLGAGTKGVPCLAWLCLAVWAAFSRFTCIVANPYPFLSPLHSCASRSSACVFVFLVWDYHGEWRHEHLFMFSMKNVFSFLVHRTRGIVNSYGTLNFEELPKCFQAIAQFSFNSNRVGVLSLLTTFN